MATVREHRLNPSIVSTKKNTPIVMFMFYNGNTNFEPRKMGKFTIVN